MKDIAAHNLLGRTLDNKWHVIAKKEKKAGDTGGTFSVCYTVEKDGQNFFMKAFNVNGFINCMGEGKTFMEYMEEMTKAFIYEKRFCREKENQEMDAEHVTAWSKGGSTDIENCQMSCKTHNRAKGNR